MCIKQAKKFTFHNFFTYNKILMLKFFLFFYWALCGNAMEGLELNFLSVILEHGSRCLAASGISLQKRCCGTVK